MSHDPYAAPSALVEDPAMSSAEAIRREHIRHETSLRSAAWIFVLAALLLGYVGAMTLYTAWRLGDVAPAGFDAVGIVLLLLSVPAAAAAWGFFTLAPWVRWVGGVLAAIGLLWIPVGTLVNGYLLYLLFGAKGRRIFAPDYADIRRRTPNVRFRRSVAEWTGLGCVVALLVLTAAWLAMRN